MAASGKMSRRKKGQGQRLPRDHGVNSRASQAVRRDGAVTCESEILSLGTPRHAHLICVTGNLKNIEK